MAGYYLYSIKNDVFTQLTSSPTKEQGDILAKYNYEEVRYALEELEEDDDEFEGSIWALDQKGLSELIVKRLALPDWYSDLSYEDAAIWDDILWTLTDTAGKKIGIGFRCDHESIYWDCAEIAAKQGAAMMAAARFGHSGFRYFGKPSSEYSMFSMYSLYPPEQTQELLKQLQKVEPHFLSLEDHSESSPREQFFQALFPAVKSAVDKGRVLWVQTDT